MHLLSWLVFVVFAAIVALAGGSKATRASQLVADKPNPMLRNYPRPETASDSLHIDSIAVHKAEHELLVFKQGKLLKVYTVRLSSQPVGPKHAAGDNKTPEGLYYINAKNPYSSFHKSLSISYPNALDMNYAKTHGLLPGGDIVIHGLPNGAEKLGKNRYRNDWTSGCIALTNDDIDELFEKINTGIPILITP